MKSLLDRILAGQPTTWFRNETGTTGELRLDRLTFQEIVRLAEEREQGRVKTNALLRQCALAIYAAWRGPTAETQGIDEVPACDEAINLVAEMRKRGWLEWEPKVTK